MGTITLQASESKDKVRSGAADIYRQNCAVCHGDFGNGKSRAQYGLNPSPRDFTTELAARELTRARMIDSVTHGRPGTGMVAWAKRLTSAEIGGVVDYIRSTFMRPPVDDNVVSGADIYKKNCAVCHGDKGNGATWTQSGLNPPPRNFTATDLYKQLPRDRMLNSVTHGRPNTAMQPFQRHLTTEEIAAVVDFVRADFMKVQNEHVSDAARSGRKDIESPVIRTQTTTGSIDMPIITADMSLPFPDDLDGRVDKGGYFFKDNCAICHGEKGDGKGPRSSFIKPSPRNFLTSSSHKTLNRPALFKSISQGKPGTVMPAWEKVLSGQQIADVAEYVFQAFIQAEPETVTLKKKAN